MKMVSPLFAPTSKSDLHKVPDTLNPSADYCVSLIIPADSEFVALLVGALSLLQEESYYERDSDYGNSGAIAVAAQFRDRTLTPLIEALLTAENCE